MTDQPEEVVISNATAQLWEDYAEASSSRAKWEAEEKRLKAKLFGSLGFEDDDPKPQPVTAVDPNGHSIFSVVVGTWHGLDQKALKAERPDIWAQYETSKPTRRFKN